MCGASGIHAALRGTRIRGMSDYTDGPGTQLFRKDHRRGRAPLWLRAACGRDAFPALPSRKERDFNGRLKIERKGSSDGLFSEVLFSPVGRATVNVASGLGTFPESPTQHDRWRPATVLPPSTIHASFSLGKRLVSEVHS